MSPVKELYRANTTPASGFKFCIVFVIFGFILDMQDIYAQINSILRYRKKQLQIQTD